MSLYTESLYKENLYPAKNITNGLIAYWPLDELTGTNVSEKVAGNDGTLANTTDAVHVAVQIENGLTLDGVDDYFDYPNSLLNRDQGSVAWWQTTPGGGDPVFYESDGTGTNYSGFGNGGVDIFEITTGIWFGGELRFDYQRGSTASNGYFFMLSVTPLTVGPLQHCAVTWDINNDAKLYIDGVLDSTKDMSTHTFSAKTATIKGVSRTGNLTASRFWAGKLDDLRVYDRVLSDQEVFQIMQFRG